MEVRGGTAGEGQGQGLSEEDESKIKEVAAAAGEDVNVGLSGGGASVGGFFGNQAGLQAQLQQPVVRWERFLPVRTLKVLLVENDDSTRQLVTALLRNCSYEVTAAADGLRAWKILEDVTNHIDLVLTEVVMPYLSGIGLLSNIMNHKTCKNVPVIMMSSKDSMGIVCKCLSKGAVDFLVKPIRKNELKNLWQHVWRRCHISSCSGSESGIWTKKLAKSRSDDDCDSDTGSSDEDDNESVGLNIMDGSDNGSGTQSSWTKRAVKINSPQPMSPSGQLGDPHDSTCAQFIHPRVDKISGRVPMTTNGECRKQNVIVDDFMGKDSGIGVTGNSQVGSSPTVKVCTKLTSESVNKLPESDPKGKGLLGFKSGIASDKPNTQAANMVDNTTNGTDNHVTTTVGEATNRVFKVSEGRDMACDGSIELPSLDLNLKKLRSTAVGGAATYEDRNVLRRSDLSAFSRYQNPVASTQASIGYVGSCSPFDNNSGVVKTDSTHNISSSDAVTHKPGSNGSSDNNDMGSTTKNVFTKPVAFIEKTISTSPINSVHTSAFQAIQLCTHQVMQEKIADVKGFQHEVQVQHSHHQYHHHHLHLHNMQQQRVPPDHIDMASKSWSAVAPHSEPAEGNAVNSSLNGSNSDGNHGSNGQDRCSTPITVGEADKRNETCGGNVSGSGSGVDQNWFAQREAALNKFRQKRKERNFQKKVRYQSRKKLAEQRPRVCGQFVRQTADEHTGWEADS